MPERELGWIKENREEHGFPLKHKVVDNKEIMGQNPGGKFFDGYGIVVYEDGSQYEGYIRYN